VSPVPSPIDRPAPEERQAPHAEPLALTRRSLAALGLGGVAAAASGHVALLMHVEAYFAALGVILPSPNFLSRVPIRFRIRDASQRYHLPVLFTPWGYSYYRGS
jgi:hypothetical protein